MGHLSSPLKNQKDILQTMLVYDWCPAWMYIPDVHKKKKWLMSCFSEQGAKIFTELLYKSATETTLQRLDATATDKKSLSGSPPTVTNMHLVVST